ncbi:MAG: hypothetical protein WAW86_05395 [Gammaproteobacteria bacterium]
MDENGNFIVIGRINRIDNGQVASNWGAALVAQKSPVPKFGEQAPYGIVQELCVDELGALSDMVLYTLPLPLPCNNYPMVFAPTQNPSGDKNARKSYPLHEAPIPDLREEDGRKMVSAITLSDWCKAQGECTVSILPDQTTAIFEFNFTGLIPESLYTVMSLREHDLDPGRLTRPGPLGVPNVFITDEMGCASYKAVLLNPFPSMELSSHNRIINVVVLWMSSQCSYGGAIGLYGLGGDIHAQLKLQEPSFFEFVTFKK